YAEKYKHIIKNYEFKPGDIVIVRNTVDEESLSGRNRDCWWGPLMVVRRTRGGTYIMCKFNGVVWQKKIGKFRVIPYQQRQKLTIRLHIEELIDVSKETLDKMEDKPDTYIATLKFPGEEESEKFKNGQRENELVGHAPSRPM
ncbi:hypothetical protein C8R44DRAFT_610418, partial [Mycena epipterygia]